MLVDEFQDVNPVQDRLVGAVSRPPPGNLFVVGDLKQSIYRFRLAEPGIFNARISALRELAAARAVSQELLGLAGPQEDS